MARKWTKRQGKLTYCKLPQMLPPNLLQCRKISRFRSSIRRFRRPRRQKRKRLTSIRISQIWDIRLKIWAILCRCSTRTTNRNRPMEKARLICPWILTVDMGILWTQTRFETTRCLLDLLMCTIILWYRVKGQCLQRTWTFLCLIFQNYTTLMWKRAMESRWNTTNLARCKSIRRLLAVQLNQLR